MPRPTPPYAATSDWNRSNRLIPSGDSCAAPIYAVKSTDAAIGIFRNYAECTKALAANPGRSFLKTFESNEYGKAMQWVNATTDTTNTTNTANTANTEGGPTKRRRIVPSKVPQNAAHMPGIKYPVAKSAIETAYEMDKRCDGAAYEPWWDEARVRGMTSVAHTQMLQEMWSREIEAGL